MDEKMIGLMTEGQEMCTLMTSNAKLCCRVKKMFVYQASAVHPSSIIVCFIVKFFFLVPEELIKAPQKA